MIKAVFIDVDNTLLDFDKCAKASMMECYNDFNLHFEDWMFDAFRDINLAMWKDMEKGLLTKEQLIRTRWSNVFKHLGIVADGEAFEKSFKHYLNEVTVLVDGAMQTLRYLASKYPLYVASNAPYNQQSHRLKNAGMLDYIKELFVSEEIGHPKPRKEFFDACFEAIPFKPEETIMIGDSVSADINGARNYGMHTCWYNHYGDTREGVECDYVVDRMQDIINIL